jgi:hypothetical protein
MTTAPAPETAPGLTMRQQFLQALAGIKAVFQAVAGELGHSAVQDIRSAYETLYVLGSHIPDVPAGSPLPYGGIADKDIAKALRHAENGMASPAVTLDLIAELRRLRAELHALGGPYGVTDDDIMSMIGEGFHTAFRKATDDPHAMVIHTLIGKLCEDRAGDGRTAWSAVVSFTAGPVIQALRDAGTRAREQEADQLKDTQEAAAGEVARRDAEIARLTAELARQAGGSR